MKTVLVTGATGFLGRQLALRLAEDGHRVHVLYRSKAKLRGLEHKNIIPFGGSLADSQSIENAMKGCQQVYHVAAFAAAWSKNPQDFYDHNVLGTENVLATAMRLGVEKLVHTSTAGVLGPSAGELNTEEKQFTGTFFTLYDQTKSQAEEKVQEFVSGGLNAVIVNPTRIYGPGYLSKSNTLTTMVDLYAKGKWKLMPGNGGSTGNYVFIEDVVDCHLLAMEKGRRGERYLSGGENLSYDEIFSILAELTGERHRMWRIPYQMMIISSSLMLATAKVLSWFGGSWQPPVIPAFVKRNKHNWESSSDKANKELGYNPVDFRTGLRLTLEWLGHRVQE